MRGPSIRHEGGVVQQYDRIRERARVGRPRAAGRRPGQRERAQGRALALAWPADRRRCRLGGGETSEGWPPVSLLHRGSGGESVSEAAKHVDVSRAAPSDAGSTPAASTTGLFPENSSPLQRHFVVRLLGSRWSAPSSDGRGPLISFGFSTKIQTGLCFIGAPLKRP